MADTHPLIHWQGAYGLPDFSAIQDEDFAPLFKQALEQAKLEIEHLASNPEPADIDHFLVPFELAGKDLSHLLSVFGLRSGACSNETIRALEGEFSAQISRYMSAIMNDPRLFNKIDTLYQRGQAGAFDHETARAIEKLWKAFIRNGAALSEEKQNQLSEINARLAELGANFSQNVLHDENEWVLYLKDEAQLAGLPQDLRDVMADIASDNGQDGYALTLARSIVEPFLSFSDNSQLRETACLAWSQRGEHDGDHDNRPIIKEILDLRLKKAQLLGFENFAAFKLDNTMAKTPDAVMNLLDPVWQKAVKKANNEQQQLEILAADLGHNAEIQPWDWRYYAQKLKTQIYDFDDAAIKPYLTLDQMIAAAFNVAHQLFGVTFEPAEAPLWHSDARLWTVKNADGSLRGLFIGDYFARQGKRSGAWMSALQVQHKLAGGQIPIVYNITNFARPAKGKPALLSVDDARTLFHEFGHALHGLLSDVTWPSLSGTSVSRDFVELPSQLYEHWFLQPQILKTYALHVDNGTPIPDDLIEKLQASNAFNAGFNAVEFTASALMDMAFHKTGQIDNPQQFEHDYMQKIAMPSAIFMRHRPTHFLHIFSGDGYSAGYYSYLWSEVLDADAFEAFEETGDIFNPQLAQKLKDNIYSAGGSRDPEALYQAFRGRMPNPQAMIRQRGLEDGTDD